MSNIQLAKENLKKIDNICNKVVAISKKINELRATSKTVDEQGNTLVQHERGLKNNLQRILDLSPTLSKLYTVDTLQYEPIYKLKSQCQDSVLQDVQDNLIQEDIDDSSIFDNLFETIEVKTQEVSDYREITTEDGETLRIPELIDKVYNITVLKSSTEDSIKTLKSGIKSISNINKIDDNDENVEDKVNLSKEQIDKLVQEGISNFLFSHNGQLAINDIVTKQHYDSLISDYLESFYSDNIKIDSQNNLIPMTTVGKKLLLQVKYFDDSQNKFIEGNLWDAIRTEAIKEVSSKYSQNISYYGQNILGKSNNHNKQFVETLKDCINLASTKLYLSNNQAYKKEDLYLELPNNPYSEPKNTQSISQSIAQTFSNPTNIIKSITGENFNSNQNANLNLTEEQRIQLMYDTQQQNFINSQTTLQNREANATYIEAPAPLSTIDADIKSLNNSNMQPKKSQPIFKF